MRRACPWPGSLQVWIRPQVSIAALSGRSQDCQNEEADTLSAPSLPSPPSPSLPLEVGPLNPARGSGESCKLPQRGLGRSPSRILVHFSVKIWHLVATILMIFLKINWSKKFKQRGTRRQLPPRAWTYSYGPECHTRMKRRWCHYTAICKHVGYATISRTFEEGDVDISMPRSIFCGRGEGLIICHL